MAAGWSCPIRNLLPFALRFRNRVPLVASRAIHNGEVMSQQQIILESDSEEGSKPTSESGKQLERVE